MSRVIFLLLHVFMAWMLIDAIKRRADGYWYLIIFVPFGEWIYFFKVKIHDPEMQWLKQALTFPRKKPPTLEQLRFRCRQTPSLSNKLRLAQAYHDAGRYQDGVEAFGQILSASVDNRDALFGLALCKLGREELEQGAELLERLIDLDPAFSDYQPWLHLGGTLWRTGRRDEALALHARLVATSPRLSHSITLAHFQAEAEQTDEARATLLEALEHFDNAPRFLQRSHRAWARQARRMLKALG